jgi:hypothetical protein
MIKTIDPEQLNDPDYFILDCSVIFIRFSGKNKLDFYDGRSKL